MAGWIQALRETEEAAMYFSPTLFQTLGWIHCLWQLTQPSNILRSSYYYHLHLTGEGMEGSVTLSLLAEIDHAGLLPPSCDMEGHQRVLKQEERDVCVKSRKD